jgi:hypothetical protein
MDDEARRVRIRQLVEALNTRDMEPFDAVYHDDVVIEWPQSGEVIRGKKNIRELRLAYPTPPTAASGASLVRETCGPWRWTSTTTETGSTPSSSTSTATSWW